MVVKTDNLWCVCLKERKDIKCKLNNAIKRYDFEGSDKRFRYGASTKTKRHPGYK